MTTPHPWVPPEASDASAGGAHLSWLGLAAESVALAVPNILGALVVLITVDVLGIPAGALMVIPLIAAWSFLRGRSLGGRYASGTGRSVLLGTSVALGVVMVVLLLVLVMAGTGNGNGILLGDLCAPICFAFIHFVLAAPALWLGEWLAEPS